MKTQKLFVYCCLCQSYGNHKTFKCPYLICIFCKGSGHTKLHCDLFNNHGLPAKISVSVQTDFVYDEIFIIKKEEPEEYENLEHIISDEELMKTALWNQEEIGEKTEESIPITNCVNALQDNVKDTLAIESGVDSYERQFETVSRHSSETLKDFNDKEKLEESTDNQVANLAIEKIALNNKDTQSFAKIAKNLAPVKKYLRIISTHERQKVCAGMNDSISLTCRMKLASMKNLKVGQKIHITLVSRKKQKFPKGISLREEFAKIENKRGDFFIKVHLSSDCRDISTARLATYFLAEAV